MWLYLSKSSQPLWMSYSQYLLLAQCTVPCKQHQTRLHYLVRTDNERFKVFYWVHAEAFNMAISKYTLTHTLHELESDVGDKHVTGELSYDA